jgi:hypothetical protein
MIITIKQVIHQGRGGHKINTFTVYPYPASKEIFSLLEVARGEIPVPDPFNHPVLTTFYG